MTKNWAAKTSADFSFAIKLWQKFTHPKKIGRKGVVSAIGFSSLRDELPEFRRTGVGNNRQPLKNLDVSRNLIEGEFSSILASPFCFLRLFDHPVRPEQHRLRNREVERFRSLQIDHEFKLRWLLDRGIFELRTFWNSVHIVNRPHLPVARLRTKGPVECIPVQELVGLE
jgi:hypothetical protein